MSGLLERFNAVPTQAGVEEILPYELLLDGFKRVPEEKDSSYKTFLEICKVAHKELPYSNILAYFLDPNNREHGLGDMVLRAFEHATEINLGETDLRSIEVRREVKTDTGHFLDLVITSDVFVIGIENKIGADLYNNFDDYYQKLLALAGPNKKLHAFVLSIKPEQINSSTHFKPLLYRTLVSELRILLDQKGVHENSRATTFLFDFINSIQHLQAGTRMDKALLNFFRENEESTVKFYQKTQMLASALRERVKLISECIEFPPVFKKPIFWGSLMNQNKTETEIYDAVACDVNISDTLSCRVEVNLSLKDNWRIFFYTSSEGLRRTEFASWIKANDIKLIDQDWAGLYAEFPFEESEEVVAQKYLEFLKLIASKLSKNSSA